MRLGYNTNGLAHHNLFDAVSLLAEIGYRSVAITIDHGVLNPFEGDWRRDAERLRRELVRHGMSCVIETGARFLLDSRVKHEPTLMSPTADARARRIAFLKSAIDIATFLEADCVSLWSGILREPSDTDAEFSRLIGALSVVLDYAQSKDVAIGFEPEPGMFIDTMSMFAVLQQRLPHPNLFLTLDIGHLHCLGETPIPDNVRRWGKVIRNVHIEDMRGNVHEHLMFGEGEIEFPPVIDALASVGYQGGLHVELSRHSHDGPNVARRAFEFLSPLVLSSRSQCRTI